MEISRSSERARGWLSELGAAFTKDLRIYTRYPSWVAGDLLSTPLWFVFFVLAIYLFSPPASFSSHSSLEGTLNYFFWGYVFVVLFNASLGGIGQFMLSEQMAGTLEQMLLAPVNRFALVAGRWARVMVTDAVVIAVTAAFLAAAEGVGVEASSPLGLLLVLGLLEAGLLGLGLALAGLTLRFRGAVTAANFAWFGVIIFSGVFFPVYSLPTAVLLVGLVLPTTYYVDAIKHYAMGTATILPPSLEVLLITSLSVALLLLGWRVFGWGEQYIKRKGRTGLY